MNTKVAIIYIATDKYNQFWDDFYASAEQHLFPGTEKRYVVFTDRSDKYKGDNIRVCKIEHKPWPYVTLHRFDYMLDFRHEWEDCTHVFFFNSNVRVLRDVASDVFCREDDKITALPACWNQSNDSDELPFERRVESEACLPKGCGYTPYYAGGLYGARTDVFTGMIRQCADWLATDAKRGITPIWHDESYLNAYLHTRAEVNNLDTRYGMPAEMVAALYLFSGFDPLAYMVFRPKEGLVDKPEDARY